MGNRLLVVALALAVTAGASAQTRATRPTDAWTRLRQELTPRPLPIPTVRDEIYPGYLKVRLTAAEATRLSQLRARRGVIQAPLPELQGATFRSQVYRSGWTVWTLPKGADPRALAAQINAGGQAFAEPLNRIYPLLGQPNDPDWSYQESGEPMVPLGDDVSFRRLWYLDDVSAWEAWNDWPNAWFTHSNRPQDQPTIAVIDTGVDINHPDFMNGGVSSDTVNGGQWDLYRSGYFTFGEFQDSPTEDALGHGTHVAGLALASGNNGGYHGKGMIGLGYRSQGMTLRVFDDSGNGSDADAAAAILYAADNGADIINLSLGTENFSQVFQDAITYAFQKGVLVVCAGNEDGSGGGDLGPIYPAACSGALAVTANGPGYYHASDYYAGSGSYIGVAAPGGNLILDLSDLENPVAMLAYMYSTTMTEDNPILHSQNGEPPPGYGLDYGYLIGTSMACPLVAGGAGLYYGKHNLRAGQGWANLRAFQAIQRSAVGAAGAPKGSWEYSQGFGCFDASLLMAGADTRGATAGTVRGIVYEGGAARANVAVKARQIGGTTVFNTTTGPDGIYRYDQLPPGEFEVWSTISDGGTLHTKLRRVYVTAGADRPGVDLWLKGAPDVTPPVVNRFAIQSANNDGTLILAGWGYDTESGIDRVSVRIGTTPGGGDAMPDTAIAEAPVVAFRPAPLSGGRTYWLTARYTNAAGLWTDGPSLYYKKQPRGWGAEFLSQNVPAQVTKGSAFAATISFKNLGPRPWASGGRVRIGLASRNDPGNTRWGTAWVALPPGHTVAPGESYTFNLGLTAPATAATYNFQWQLVNGGEAISDLTPNVRIRVVN